jgi:hypothetical protein
MSQGSEYDEHNLRRQKVYREAFRLAEQVVGERPETEERRLLNDMEDLEKTYHYAQRFIPYFTSAVASDTKMCSSFRAKRLAAMRLAFKVVYRFVDTPGIEGLGYNGKSLKYIPERFGEMYAEKPWREKYGITQSFMWIDDPWMLVHVIEKMAGSIRRVKATAVIEVLEKLFIKEEIESAPKETVGVVADPQ